MEEAIRRGYPLAQWQVRVVHRVRSSRAQVRARDRALLAQDRKGIYGARSRVEALEALELILASQAPHEVVLLDGSLTTPLIYFNQALNKSSAVPV